VKQKNRDCQQGGISLLKIRSSIPFVSRFDRLSRESDRLLAISKRLERRGSRGSFLHGDHVLTVASQSFLGSRGGIARLCDITAGVAVEAGYQLSLLSLQNEGGTYQERGFWQGWVPREIRGCPVGASAEWEQRDIVVARALLL
jgi:hypothetical protein